MGPLLLHVRTEKGRGYLPAEAASDRMHGVGKYDVKTGKQAPTDPTKVVFKYLLLTRWLPSLASFEGDLLLWRFTEASSPSLLGNCANNTLQQHTVIKRHCEIACIFQPPECLTIIIMCCTGQWPVRSGCPVY